MNKLDHQLSKKIHTSKRDLNLIANSKIEAFNVIKSALDESIPMLIITSKDIIFSNVSDIEKGALIMCAFENIDPNIRLLIIKSFKNE